MDRKDYNYKNRTAYPDTYHTTKEYSKENRTVQTDTEEILWERLRKKALGVKFRRQHIIGDYIADFICLDKKLIIEVDCGYHNLSFQREEDNIRSAWLNKQGFYVLRFTNEAIINDLDYVISKINETLSSI